MWSLLHSWRSSSSCTGNTLFLLVDTMYSDWLHIVILSSDWLLQESGCPGHIVNELMENAHERRWPPGLQTLETRQMNRRQYEQYVCKRIPGKQAVVSSKSSD